MNDPSQPTPPLVTWYTTCLDTLEEVTSLEALQSFKVSVFGKKGTMTHYMKELGSMTAQERQEKGQTYHRIRTDLQKAFEHKMTMLKAQALQEKCQKESVDITLPVTPKGLGRIHPLRQGMDDAVAILMHMGFERAHGPHIEEDFYNFTALNIPDHHPARQDQDTFYLKHTKDDQRLLLRTHTSPVQIRALKTQGVPIKIIAPGRVFRSDYDQTHTPMFHQIEGLYLDQGIHMGHLKGCLMAFCRSFFKNSCLQLRFRPGYFPFTEPSAEVDISCEKKAGRLVIGAGDAWLEVLGAGMVHPKVIANAGLDPDSVQGFAFGLGIERFTMLREGMMDLRAFYEGDKGWLEHHGVCPSKAFSREVHV